MTRSTSVRRTLPGGYLRRAGSCDFQWGDLHMVWRPARAPASGMLSSSAFISWIFAKSVYNASVLGGAFGWVGGVGYASWHATPTCAVRVWVGVRAPRQVASCSRAWQTQRTLVRDEGGTCTALAAAASRLNRVQLSPYDH